MAFQTPGCLLLNGLDKDHPLGPVVFAANHLTTRELMAPFHKFGPYWGFKKHKPIKQSHQPFNMHAQNSIETIGSEKKSPWHVWAIHLF